MLKYRLITGPILIAVLLGLILLDEWIDTVELNEFWSGVFNGKSYLPNGIVLFALGMAVLPLAAAEICRICRSQGIATSVWLTAMAADIGLVLCYSIPMGTPTVTTIAVVSTGLIMVFVASLFTFAQGKNVQGIVASAGAVMFTMVYLGFMLGFLLALRREHSAWWTVGIIAITKTCDSGAYFTGRTIGRHKLIPWLSPGKTWEGLIGGIVSAVGAGVLLAWASQAWLSHDAVPLWLGAVCGVAFAIVGQFGDLTMSLFKRGAGVKDSSQLLPGLGGVMDVLDSPLMVAPVAYWLLTALS